jgi:hypothetical protein
VEGETIFACAGRIGLLKVFEADAVVRADIQQLVDATG